MKTLYVLLFGIILIFAGCSKTNDFQEDNLSDIQLKSADSRTINFEMTGDYIVPIICNGEMVDYLEVLEGDEGGENLFTHATGHMIDGKLVWCIVHVKGTLKSQLTGETYKINETDKLTFDENEAITSILSRTHAIGDRGTHVIMFFTVDFESLEFVLLKGICPQIDN